MKKIIFISSLFFATCILQAQTTVTTTGGTANYVTKFSGTSTVVNSSIFDDGSKIGLFTAAPDQIFELRHSTPFVRLRDNNNTTDVNGTCVIEFGQESGGAWSRTSYIGDGFSGVRALGIVLDNSSDFLISSNANPSANPGLFFENSNQYVGINTLTPGSELDVKGTLRLSGSTSGYVGFAPAAAAGSTTYTMPSADGSSGQVLQTNGSGTLSWLTTSTPTSAWQLTGNTVGATGNFIGTIDDYDVVFKRNNVQSGLLNASLYNTSWGVGALNPNTTGGSNTAMGTEALTNNLTGLENVAIGKWALYSNTSGYINTAIGTEALYYNTTGTNNTATGYEALYSNTTGLGNTAYGVVAIFNNTSGNYNTAIGLSTLFDNTTGTGNTGVGNVALAYTTGDYNSALGRRALLWNTSGNYNTAVGNDAGYYTSNGTGSNNTFIGYGTIANGDYSNATAIGKGAITTAPGYVVIGSTTVSQIGGWLDWTNMSDGRFKINVTENVKGLEFIKKLRPVTYQMDTKAADDFLIQNMPDSIKTDHQAGMDFVPSTAIIHSGFIAQEVDSAAQACGFVSSIVHTPADSITTPYALSYAEFVVPLVKAVQEQQKMIDSLKQRQNVTDSLLVALQSCCTLGSIQKNIQNNDDDQLNLLSNHNIELANNAVLYQNAPNPFSDGTSIKYFVPGNADAQIVFYDEYGSQLKVFKIEEKGIGQLNVSASNLAAGMYSYSLIVNGKVADTKKMLKQ